jgi:peptidyl-prolyl cis-trans isomerase C
MPFNRKQLFTALAVSAALGIAAPVFAQKAKEGASEKAEKPAKPAKAEKSDKSLGVPSKVAVNGVLIPQAYFEILGRQAAASGRAGPDPQAAIREELVNREVLAQAAKKKGIDKNADVAVSMDLARQGVLIQAYFEDYVKANPIKDEDLKTQYEQIRAQMGDNEYKARHILVEKEDDAKAIIADLKKGGDFNALAKEKSKDPGSKDHGGDLDWGPASRYVKPFGDALKALQKGQTTDTPVQTQFGWHVIHLDDVRPVKAPVFDEVKTNLMQRAQQEQIAKLVQELRSKAKVEEK